MQQPIKDNKLINRNIKLFLLIILSLSIFLIIINKEVIIQFYYKNNKYKLGIEKKENSKYEEAIQIFTELDNFRKSNNQIKECYFLLGEQYYTLGEFDEAIKYYENSFKRKNVSDNIQKCNNAKALLGTYQYGDLILTLSNNWTAYEVSNHIKSYGEKYSFKYDDENKQIIIDKSYYTRDKKTMKQMKGYNYIKYDVNNNELHCGENCYKKINNETDKPYTLYLPKIGMTYEEVENSAFGLPNSKANEGGYGKRCSKYNSL